MANIKISELVQALTKNLTDWLVIVQDGATKKIQLKDLIDNPVNNLDSTNTELSLSANQGRILNEKFSVDYIVEKGNNTNGNYIKYNSGLMICYKKVSFTNIAKSRSWNGRFIPSSALNLGNFPVAFIEIPTVSITLSTIASVLFLGDQSPSKTSAGTFYPLGFDNSTIANLTVNVIAYGKWK